MIKALLSGPTPCWLALQQTDAKWYPKVWSSHAIGFEIFFSGLISLLFQKSLFLTHLVKWDCNLINEKVEVVEVV